MRKYCNANRSGNKQIPRSGQSIGRNDIPTHSSLSPKEKEVERAIKLVSCHTIKYHEVVNLLIEKMITPTPSYKKIPLCPLRNLCVLCVKQNKYHEVVNRLIETNVPTQSFPPPPCKPQVCRKEGFIGIHHYSTNRSTTTWCIPHIPTNKIQNKNIIRSST